MTSAVMNDSPPDAYRNSPVLRPGCTHMLGCKCTVPYHLRESTDSELRVEQQLRAVFVPAAPAIEAEIAEETAQ